MAYETASRMPAGDPSALRSGVAVLFDEDSKISAGGWGSRCARSSTRSTPGERPRKPYLPDFQRRRPYQVVL